jgi:tetratricopeptide (TPR) repeat protein
MGEDTVDQIGVLYREGFIVLLVRACTQFGENPDLHDVYAFVHIRLLPSNHEGNARTLFCCFLTLEDPPALAVRTTRVVSNKTTAFIEYPLRNQPNQFNIMSTAEESTGSVSTSTPPSAMETTAGDDSTGGTGTATTADAGPGPVGMEVVGRSMQDPDDKESEALKLKDLGNEQLLKGHFLEAIGFYSDALEYSPTNPIILSNRAQAYIKVENYGVAMADATAALDSDPTYAKAYYRRGSSQFALGHLKDARKDFRQVCKLQPKSKDARSKLQACEKAIREEAFRKAIESEMTVPLSETYDPNAVILTSSYDGPNPLIDGPTEDTELEASLFEPGKLPREFVLVSKTSFKQEQRLI